MTAPHATPSSPATGRILEEPDVRSTAPAPPPPSTWTPLRTPTFRLLWSVTLVANICMWMNDVAAAWMMTSLTTSPVLVALVQTASTLPVFLLGLPSGALADILDRRRYFIFTQFWVAVVAVLLCAALALDVMNAPLLLALTFANGIGMAMRWPVFSALIPEVISKPMLPSAMALNAVAMNASRIVGPLVAGALIASAGTLWVFVLNAVLSIVAGLLLLTWQRTHVTHPLGRERLPSAMRVGLQFIKESPRMRAVIARTVAFFFMSTAIMALLPLTAKRFDGIGFISGAGVFTLLLASMGAGAIIGAMFLPRIRQMFTGEPLVLTGTLLQAASTVGVALAPNLPLAVVCMMTAGLSLIATANTLGVKAQMALPNWVRARGMSAYQMSIMGGTAIGAALWGKVAALSSVPVSLIAAAVTGVVCMLIVQRVFTDRQALEDLSPSKAFQPPRHSQPEEGRVVVHIEYLINPAKARRFRTLMQESRRSRMRQGALSWRLLHSMERPERYIEEIVDESWVEHLRRFDRITASDVALRERKLAFHVADTPPRVTRFFETD
ncbi:arabinose ABC transporter permease [Comamonas kerstersii]|uniref:Arabinose ABC transporter permease n=1 Tax=Comamonas kerstersii TaxID=225992 RepID=A0A1V0BDA5_9BURK|nr:MFS transporter [Comamonas kerstersii]AQZ97852.1 arabinose ABC transporter permease [Comamonas kerstersii]